MNSYPHIPEYSPEESQQKTREELDLLQEQIFQEQAKKIADAFRENPANMIGGVIDLFRKSTERNELQDLSPYFKEGFAGVALVKMIQDLGFDLSIEQGKTHLYPRGKTYIDNEKTLQLEDALDQELQNPNTYRMILAGMLYSTSQLNENVAQVPTDSHTFIQTLSLQDQQHQNVYDQTFLKNPSLIHNNTDFPFSEYITGLQDATKQYPPQNEVIYYNGQPVYPGNIQMYPQNPPFIPRENSQIPSGTPQTSPYFSNALRNNTTLSKIGNNVSDIAGKSVLGFMGGVNDIFEMGGDSALMRAGIGLGLIWGIWKLFHLKKNEKGELKKFSFLRGIGAILALGLINNPQALQSFQNLAKDATKPFKNALKNTPYSAPKAKVEKKPLTPNRLAQNILEIEGADAENFQEKIQIFKKINAQEILEVFASGSKERYAEFIEKNFTTENDQYIFYEILEDKDMRAQIIIYTKTLVTYQEKNKHLPQEDMSLEKLEKTIIRAEEEEETKNKKI